MYNIWVTKSLLFLSNQNRGDRLWHCCLAVGDLNMAQNEALHCIAKMNIEINIVYEIDTVSQNVIMILDIFNILSHLSSPDVLLTLRYLEALLADPGSSQKPSSF